MKERHSSKPRVKNLSLLVGLICFTLAIWAWGRKPVLHNMIPPSDEFVVPSPVIPDKTHSSNSHHASYVIEVPSVEETQSETKSESAIIVEETQSETDSEDKALTTTKVTEENLSREEKLDEETRRGDMNMVNITKNECNYAKGKWVPDSRRPLYSGLGCKQWLSEMWSCISNQRMDTSYEQFKWQPKDCEMPEFDGPKFLERMRDKTIAIVGDSLGRQQFQSLMCMITGGIDYPYVEDIGHQYGLTKPHGAKRPDGWAYRFSKTNTTVLYYWSASLCDLEPINSSDPLTNVAMHLDRPVRFLRAYIPKFHVLVLNTGHHWNRGKVNGNRWIMYVNGRPNTDKKIAIIWNAKNLTVQSVTKWADTQMKRYPALKVFFRTISPRHFQNGDWNTGGSCDNTVPLASGSEVNKDGSDDPVVENAVKGTRVKILDITALSQLRDEGHVAKYGLRAQPGMYDCLHWCLPGVPDTWNELLAAQI